MDNELIKDLEDIEEFADSRGAVVVTLDINKFREAITAIRQQPEFEPLLPPTKGARGVFRAALQNNPDADMKAIPNQWLLNERAITEQAVNNEEKSHSKTIAERDHWHDKATELAELVGGLYQLDVGEHTSANCPVENAISYCKHYDLPTTEQPQPASKELVESLQEALDDSYDVVGYDPVELCSIIGQFQEVTKAAIQALSTSEALQAPMVEQEDTRQ